MNLLPARSLARPRAPRSLIWSSGLILALVLGGCAPAAPAVQPSPSSTQAPATDVSTATSGSISPSPTGVETTLPPAATPTEDIETPTATAATPTTGAATPVATVAPVVEATAAASGDAGTEPIQAVEQRLLPAMYLASTGAPYMDLTSRMAHYNVPGVSVAVINEGKLEWAKGYGVREAGAEAAVDEDTLFQAASISKPVTALAALRLVQAGVLSLDDDVSGQLRSWKLPQSDLTQREKVTLHRLLNHTAGLTVNGFEGYTPGAPLPTASQILSGQPPANSRPVSIATTPGERWNYSGGGYVVVQQLIEDVTGKPFSEVVKEQVLAPLGMTNSTFSQPLAQELQASAASGHTRSGDALPERWHVYPELAPAGLWSTPSDIARFAIAIQDAANGEEGAILSPELAEEMLTASLSNWGLGVQLGGSESARWFAHGGTNAGYRARMIAFLEEGKGAVVITNGDAGIDLFNEILRAIADVYDWPDLQAQAKTVATVDRAVLESLAGRYDIIDDPGYGFTVQATEDGLQVATSDGTSLFQPESDLVYFDLESGLQIFFTRDASGAVTGLETRLPTGSGVKANRAR